MPLLTLILFSYAHSFLALSFYFAILLYCLGRQTTTTTTAGERRARKE
jgi:hypothetical protein